MTDRIYIPRSVEHQLARRKRFIKLLRSARNILRKELHEDERVEIKKLADLVASNEWPKPDKEA